MIYYYFTTNQKLYGMANMVMVTTSDFIQCVIALASTSKMKTSTKIEEILYVMLFIKPGVDAYRVATDWTTDEEQHWDPLMELAMTKACETVAEAMPASIFQAYAYFQASKRSNIAIVSIVISIATTSFTSTTMTFDYDTSPKKRAANPFFYGFVRPEMRGLTFLVQFGLTYLQ